MTRVDPVPYIWWLISRASGILALGLLSLAVLIGLTMSTRILARPGLKRSLMRLHEHVAIIGLAAICVHGLSLLGDRWLRPGLAGIAIPFAMSYRPLFTGLGILAGYLAALLGLSFYVRRRIGAKLWRKMHRATVLVWVLGVVHTLGAGSDASAPWLRGIVVLTGLPILYLIVLRILQSLTDGRRRTVRTGERRNQGPPEQRREKGATDAIHSDRRRVGMRGPGRLRRRPATGVPS